MTFYRRVFDAAIIGVAFMFLVFLLAGVRAAYPHDVYTGLRGNQGQLCCGGDPVTGDCEPLQWEQVAIHQDGTVTIQSKRYTGSVTVAAEKITWLPVAAGPDGIQYPGHWCGVRNTMTSRVEFPDQIDRAFWTYCLFLAPGGY